MNYEVIETDEQVNGTEFVTRFYLRALRRCKKLNKQKKVAFYRYEIIRENKKWIVVAMKNQIVYTRFE